MNIQTILDKYNCKIDSYYEENSKPYEESARERLRLMSQWAQKGEVPFYASEPYEYRLLKNKWNNYVNRNDIGISLAQPAPILWYTVLDNLFEELKLECPNFLINKCYIKYGGLRLELDNITKEIQDQLILLHENLFDCRLI